MFKYLFMAWHPITNYLRYSGYQSIFFTKMIVYFFSINSEQLDIVKFAEVFLILSDYFWSREI